MRAILLLLTILAFIGSCIWAYNVRDYEPYLAVVTSIIALIGLWVTDSPGPPTMNQRGGKNSKNFQAGGSIVVNSKDKKNER
jgi:hypothetical protein